MEETSENVTSFVPQCLPWVDAVETSERDSHVVLVEYFVSCIATIFANILLFVIIFSNKDFKDQVKDIKSSSKY